MKRLLATAIALLLAAITAGLAWLTIARARLPYENGRNFDEADSLVHDEGAIVVYGLLTLVAATATGLAVRAGLRARRRS